MKEIKKIKNIGNKTEKITNTETGTEDTITEVETENTIIEVSKDSEIKFKEKKVEKVALQDGYFRIGKAEIILKKGQKVLLTENQANFLESRNIVK